MKMLQKCLIVYSLDWKLFLDCSSSVLSVSKILKEIYAKFVKLLDIQIKNNLNRGKLYLLKKDKSHTRFGHSLKGRSLGYFCKY